MAYTFGLRSEDGDDLGSFASSEPNWDPGHVLHRGGGDDLEVVRVADADDGDDVEAYLIVKPHGASASTS
ncbi:MAG: hypothetical protein ACJ76I_12060 [Gaiellaceae bacterium]